MAKCVVVVGGGMVGTSLAQMLLQKQYGVQVVEVKREEILRLQRDLGPAAILSGDGTDPRVLELADIRGADVVAATTGRDETNLVISSLAKFAFNVGRTVARVNNPKNAWMFTPVMGVDIAVNQSEIMAGLILKETLTK